MALASDLAGAAAGWTIAIIVAAGALSLLITYWVIRAAVLSALTEHHRRVEYDKMKARKRAKKLAKRAAVADSHEGELV